MWLTGVWTLKMNMLGKRCGWLWSSRWRSEDGLILSQMWNCELWVEGAAQESGARRRTAGAGVWMLGLRKMTRFFFVFIVPLKPNRFGSVGVFSVSGFWNRNRTEPKLFVKKLIGLIGFFFRFGFFGYFFLGFLGLFGFSVFLLTPRSNILPIYRLAKNT
jgi:hypothetical protein